MTEEFFQKLYDLPISETIRASAMAFPWLESVHVLADHAGARLDRCGGSASARPRVGEPAGDDLLVRQMLPITWVAFAIAVFTGGAMFLSNAVDYSKNLPFRMKMLLMLLAGLNMVFFHLVTYRSIGTWNESRQTPCGARWAGGFSILTWIGVVAFGRWIGFTIGF